MSLIIRPAKLYDYDGYCELAAQIDKLHRDHHPDHFQEAVPPRTFEYYVLMLSNANQHILVAEVDGQVAGLVEWIVTYANKDIPILKPRTAIMIDTLVVHDNYQRRGIGRKLMAAVEDWARENNIVNVELGVWLFNESAIKFYQSLGYSFYRARMIHKLDEE